MELRLKFEPAEQGDGGVIHIFKVDGTENVDIGYLVYGNLKEKAWAEEILLDGHPNVIIIE
ncbi:MAG: hypothetical protein PHW93_02330 [Candidatus Methanomethylophilaceae archaeon]|nr:hypothetical protein [Candidatus Methanomethylophilaceae archaeon]NBK25154.1 hypothetical protein [Spirochaetia bacterium]